ncbi:Syntaxin-1A [Cucumispora dikerogammari]|nr:Syntaxin-1A [Cucumispora dikerogammari]
MQEFLKTTRKTANKIDRLARYVNKMHKISSTKTNNIFTHKQEKKQYYKIDAVNQIIRKKTAQINILIKSMRETNENTDALSIEVRENQIRSLSLKFSRVLNKYRDIQIQNGKLEIERTKKEYLIMNPQATTKDLNEYLNSHGKTQKSVFAVGSERSTVLNKRIEERHKRIKNISEDAVALAELIQMNKDLIFAQRKTVDRIEINIETALEEVQEANQNLEDAREYQRRANELRNTIIKIVVGVLIALGVGGLLWLIISRSGGE